MRKHYAVGNFFLSLILYDNKGSLAPCIKGGHMCSSFSVLLRIRTSNREEHKHRGQARANNSGGVGIKEMGK